MTRYKYYQPNKKDIKDKYADCVIRALTKSLDMQWLNVFDELQPISRDMQAPYNCKPCYEYFLSTKGFKYYGVSNTKGVKRPTVQSFAEEHASGIYILRVAHHIVTVMDGYYYDTWDCGKKSLYGYWSKQY